MSAARSKDGERLVRVLAARGVTLVLDVGANVGQYGLRLRRDGYRGRIVSFEPAKGAHAALAGAAAGDDRWTVAPRLALGDRAGTLALNVSASSDMSSALPYTAEAARLFDDAGFVRAETVPLARLDAVFDRFVGAGDVVHLKIDTQGTEAAVLAGAAGVLDRIALVQTELSIVPVYQGEPGWREMVDRLEALGFRPVLFMPGYFNNSTARLIGMDGVFVRN